MVRITILLGILTIASLFTTAILGILLHVYRKPVFRYHKLFAFITILLAIIHASSVIYTYML